MQARIENEPTYVVTLTSADVAALKHEWPMIREAFAGSGSFNEIAAWNTLRLLLSTVEAD